MINREKVIEGLELCASGSECIGRDCPYWHNVLDDAIKGCDCTTELVRDSLTMLKEQEAMRVLSQRECETLPNHYERKGFCPKCHQVVEWFLNRSYCGFCGQAVKWE